MARAATTTARRYAEAAFELAERDGLVDEWLAQLDRLAGALRDPAVLHRLEDPNVPLETRHAAFEALFERPMIRQLSAMLTLIMRRRRLESLPDIAREFRRLHNRRAGIVEATAISAAPLDDTEVAALRARLEQMTGGRVELSLSVDPALLGGVQVRLGDLLMDGSVRGRLERLRSRVASGSLTS